MKMLTNSKVLLEWRKENMLQLMAAGQVIKHSYESDLKIDLAVRGNFHSFSFYSHESFKSISISPLGTTVFL